MKKAEYEELKVVDRDLLFLVFLITFYLIIWNWKSSKLDEQLNTRRNN